jgi:hypothetical protein
MREFSGRPHGRLSILIEAVVQRNHASVIAAQAVWRRSDPKPCAWALS